MKEDKRGILFIMLGIIFIVIRIVSDDPEWSILDYVKVVVGISMIVAGIVMIVKEKRGKEKL